MYNYLALGDSITVGVGAPPGMGYVDILNYYLQNSYPLVYTKKIAQKGWKSGDLLSALSKNPHSQYYLSTANLITLYIGGNDLSFAFVKARLAKNAGPLYEAVRRFSIQFNEILRMIRTYSKAPVFTATFYNPFPYSPLASQFIYLLNQAITSIAQNYSVPVADVFNAFHGKEYALIDGYQDGKLRNFIPFLQKNPIHPNEWGHKVIADCFWQLITKKYNT
jgi:lysophospholipase L1-like esterase